MKTETIEEFLARGGTIERGCYIEPKRKLIIPVKTNNNIESMSDFSDLFGYVPKKSKPINNIFDNLIILNLR